MLKVTKMYKLKFYGRAALLAVFLIGITYYGATQKHPGNVVLPTGKTECKKVRVGSNTVKCDNVRYSIHNVISYEVY